MTSLSSVSVLSLFFYILVPSYVISLYRAGVAVTGVFIALRVLLDQLKIEGTANVFQAVKVLRIQRAAMVQTMVSIGIHYTLLQYITHEK